MTPISQIVICVNLRHLRMNNFTTWRTFGGANWSRQRFGELLSARTVSL